MSRIPMYFRGSAGPSSARTAKRRARNSAGTHGSIVDRQRFAKTLAVGFSAALAGTKKTITANAIAVKSIENRRMSDLLSVKIVIKIELSLCRDFSEDVSESLARIFIFDFYREFLSPLSS